MSSPIGWFWPLVTCGGVVIALLGARSEPVVLAAAGVVLLAATMTCARVFGWNERNSPEKAVPLDPIRLGVRELFVSGAPGREEILSHLDRLDERTSGGPGVLSFQARERLLTISDDAFVQYVRARVEGIEGRR